MKNVLLAVFAVSLTSNLLAQGHDGSHDGTSDEEAVKAVIVSGYVEGMHINRDAAAAKKAFHPEFIMHVSRDGEVSQVTIDQWTSRLSGEKNEREITYEFEWVDVVGDAAKAKLLLFQDGEHIFTDYMGLYRMEDGWKIVNKIFDRH